MRGQINEASMLLNQLETAHPAFKPLDAKLLKARLLEKADVSAALAIYEELMPIFPGLEAKCRYAELLQSLGHQTQAKGIFEEVLQHVRRFNISHEAEQEWVRFARSQLKG